MFCLIKIHPTHIAIDIRSRKIEIYTPHIEIHIYSLFENKYAFANHIQLH